LVNVYQATNDTAGLIDVLRSWLQINPRDDDAKKLLERYGGKAPGTP
jgi:hypothetical protein